MRIGGSPRKAFGSGRWSICAARSTPAPAREPRPSRSRGSSRARCRKAASKSSPIGPSTWSGSRAGSRIRTARSASSSVMIAVADVEEAARALRPLHRPRCRPHARRLDDRARPRPCRSRQRRRIRPDAARDRDPIAAFHRRLRHQGEIAGGIVLGRPGLRTDCRARRGVRRNSIGAWQFRQASLGSRRRAVRRNERPIIAAESAGECCMRLPV